MDVVTHVMTGLTFSSLVAFKKDKLYPLLLTGVVASAIPDVDSFIRVFGSDVFLKYHRVFTHTVFALPILAALASLPAWFWTRTNYLLYYFVAFFSLVLHLFLDYLCVWPLRLMYPFDQNGHLTWFDPDKSKDYALNLFHNKDTSYVALAITTLAAMGLLYLHQKRIDRQKKDSRSAAS